MLAILIPNRFFDPDLRHITVASSLPGTWRFGLWFTDACRAGYCRRPKWPPTRRAASAVLANGSRPRRVHIQMTTDHKDPDITCAVTGATLPPIRQDRVPVSLWIGTGSACDSIMADHLDDWLRGRFLSGNDKSNSYRLLSGRSKTMRVPDASDYPIVVIKGPGIDRMVQNYRRRSGHLPRNKTRAITLGSAKPFFILRCVTRKRVEIWTMMVSPIMATRA